MASSDWSKVAILGAGSSAAYIHLVCREWGITPDVYTNRMGRPPGGAFWFYRAPEFSPAPLRDIHIFPLGSADFYMQKQWGEDFRDWPCSFPTEARTEHGYAPADIWDELWDGATIQITEDLSDEAVKQIADRHEVVFMTFPTQESKEEMKEFVKPTPVLCVPLPQFEQNVVLYDGRDSNAVRTSILFGTMYTEYKRSTPVGEIPDGGKMVWFDDLLPSTPAWDPTRVPADNVYLVGRYAEWSRKILSHQADLKAHNILEMHEVKNVG